MKNIFPGYFIPNNTDITTWWETGLFVPDANVILDLYRYSEPTLMELLEVLNSLADRLWMPHQAALEFMRNRPDVILTQLGMYDKAKKILDGLKSAAEEEIRKNLTFQNHPFIDKDDFSNRVKTSLETIEHDLDKQRSSHPNLLSDDYLLDRISVILDGKVGSSYTTDRLQEIYIEGSKRYEKHIPPGYMDSEGPQKKDGDDKYGDLVLWFQIIDKALEVKKPILFITNDRKEDWWWLTKGKTLGPRPELVSELLQKAGVVFYMYNTERFAHYAKEQLGAEVKQASINEIRDVTSRKNHLRNTIAHMNASLKYSQDNEMFEYINAKWREIIKIARSRNANIAGLLNASMLYKFEDDTVIIAFRSDVLKSQAEKHIDVIQDIFQDTLELPINIKFIKVDVIPK